MPPGDDGLTSRLRSLREELGVEGFHMGMFFIGLLAGVALGMWCAILLYRYTGKAQPGWPLRRKHAKTTAPADTDEGRPADDFTEEYYEEQELLASQATQSSGGNAKSVSKPRNDARPQVEDVSSDTPRGAAASVVYTAANADANSEIHADVDDASARGSSVEIERSPQDEGPPNADNTAAQSDAYTSLLAWMDGDVRATEALIEAERKRTPAVSRSRLIENALLRQQYGHH